MTSESKHKLLIRIVLTVLVWGILSFLCCLIFPELRSQPASYLFLPAVLLPAVFYLNDCVLIPRFLSRRKLKSYGCLVIAILFFVYLVNELWEMAADPDASVSSTFHFHPEHHQAFGPGSVLLVLSMVSLAASTGIHGIREWFKHEHQVKESEHEKLQAELSYLTAQVNPHFLFNALNCIYALARQKSDKTPDAIMQLSLLMRYLVYDANTTKVLLTKEISHMENLIDLQKLRLAGNVQVEYEVVGNPEDILIEPLLFSCFVENAFKHGVDYAKPGIIKIDLTIVDKIIKLTVANPLVAKSKATKNGAGGIGLENIRKRLDLLYPAKHSLLISESDQHYSVELILNR
ncbi:sensor histidine kinase [Gaoshiqia sp. Z1-71]|uniref:sensor histidine kinase n=1 Tax=Gaoshiqia hydrogeniformans TaxID=3290090 RepID=UPI003BF7A505